MRCRWVRCGRCHGRQQRTGLPAHLLTQLEPFLQSPVPDGPDVILTGEYTRFNLLHQGIAIALVASHGDSGRSTGTQRCITTAIDLLS